MKIVFLSVVAALSLLLSPGGVEGAAVPEPEKEPIYWDNEILEEVHVDCECGYGLHRVWSEFVDAENETDRLWKWECVEVSSALSYTCKIALSPTFIP